MSGADTGACAAVRQEAARLLGTVGLADESPVHVVSCEQRYPGPFQVTRAAGAVVTAAVAATARYAAPAAPEPVTVDVRHAAAAFRSERLLQAPQLADAQLWDDISGNYRTADGWVRLHTNQRAHRDAALRVLGVRGDAQAVRATVQGWSAQALEDEVVAAGGVAARMRTRDEWRASLQGQAVAAAPLVDVRASAHGSAGDGGDPAPGQAPLSGLRVLDLTRVIAGPVCTRFLAAYGADVLRVDGPGLDDGILLEADTGAGKRRCRLDLRAAADRRAFELLLRDADVLVQSYRPGALEGLGYGARELQALRPGLVVANLSGYGSTGPWRGRRAFDSVVQVATGLAHASAFDERRGPGALPVQALDHSSGYLLALGVVAALHRRRLQGGSWVVANALAGTGEWLWGLGRRAPAVDDDLGDADDLLQTVVSPQWGPVTLVRPPGTVGAFSPRWPGPPQPAGTGTATWR